MYVAVRPVVSRLRVALVEGGAVSVATEVASRPRHQRPLPIQPADRPLPPVLGFIQLYGVWMQCMRWLEHRSKAGASIQRFEFSIHLFVGGVRHRGAVGYFSVTFPS